MDRALEEESLGPITGLAQGINNLARRAPPSVTEMWAALKGLWAVNRRYRRSFARSGADSLLARRAYARNNAHRGLRHGINRCR